MYQTSVIALSASQAKQFKSEDTYVVISFTDVGAKHPYIHKRAGMMDRIALHLDDVEAGDEFEPDGFQRYYAMSEQQAAKVASFVNAWWSRVATIVVHCHAGVSRSVGVAVAIRRHFGQNDDDLWISQKNANKHCWALVAKALEYSSDH